MLHTVWYDGFYGAYAYQMPPSPIGQTITALSKIDWPPVVGIRFSKICSDSITCAQPMRDVVTKQHAPSWSAVWYYLAVESMFWIDVLYCNANYMTVTSSLYHRYDWALVCIARVCIAPPCHIWGWLVWISPSHIIIWSPLIGVFVLPHAVMWSSLVWLYHHVRFSSTL